jgi:hypothetical protein
MPKEVINNGLIRPKRIETLLALLQELDHAVPLKLIGDLLMPLEETDARDIVRDVVDAAEYLNLIERSEQNGISLFALSDTFAKFKSPYEALTLSVLSAKKPSDDNFVLSQFYAWLIVHTSPFSAIDIHSFKPADIAGQFVAQVRDSDEGRSFNSTKFNNFRDWSEYLGLGDRLGNRLGESFFPIPYRLISHFLYRFFDKDSEIPLTEFVRRASQDFAFLDEGSVFETIPNRPAAYIQTLSPAYSLALRMLEEQGAITMKRVTDLPNVVKIFSDDDCKLTLPIGPILYTGHGN